MASAKSGFSSPPSGSFARLRSAVVSGRAAASPRAACTCAERTSSSRRASMTICRTSRRAAVTISIASRSADPRTSSRNRASSSACAIHASRRTRYCSMRSGTGVPAGVLGFNSFESDISRYDLRGQGTAWVGGRLHKQLCDCAPVRCPKSRGHPLKSQRLTRPGLGRIRSPPTNLSKICRRLQSGSHVQFGG